MVTVALSGTSSKSGFLVIVTLGKTMKRLYTLLGSNAILKLLTSNENVVHL